MKDLRLRKFSAVLSLFAAYGLMTTTGKAQATTTTTTTTTPAPAAAPTSDEPQVLEKFVVTGSNIPMAADALAVPVTVIGQQQILDSGVSSSITEILRKGSPQFSGNGNIGNENAQISTATNYGGSQVSIHNLSTLVLLDGHRVAYDPAESEGGNEFVDLNMIPVAAVDRIEVLSDGASAIYGSDAVGGVVNIILKKDYNGFDIGARYAFSTNTGHYAERQGWVVGGAANGDTSILTAIEYTQQDPMLEKDRTFTNPIYGTDTFPGHLDVLLGSAGFADQFYNLAPGVNAPPGGGLYTIDQLVAMGIYIPVSSSADFHTFNLANAETLEQSLKRISGVVNIDHKIYGDTLDSFGSVLFSNVKTYSTLNGQPLVPYISDPYTDLIDYGVTPPPPGATFIPASAPTNPFSQAFLDGQQDFASGALVLPRDRLIPFPRTFADDDTLLRVTGGLRGKVGNHLNWEISADINRYELNYTNGGLIDTANFNAAMANGTLNPFAIVQAPGVLPGTIVGQAFFNGLSTLNDFEAKIFGDIWDLPGGELGYSAGIEYMYEGLEAQVDENSIPDPVTGVTGWSNSPSLQPFSVHRDVTSFFAELSAPLVGANQNIPGLHSVYVDLAGRYDDYSQVGNSRVPKISVSYEPFDDTLKFRFSAGKAFVAPTLFELHGPISSGATNPITYTDFGGGTTNLEQFQSVGGSNPALQPSTATTWTAGFIWTPKEVKGLSISADYYQTVQKGLVGSDSQQTIVQSVELLGPASIYSQYVHFKSPTGPEVTAPGQLSTAFNNNVYIVTPLINLSGQAVKGIDGTIEYKYGTDMWGKFDLATTATIYNSYLLQSVPSEDYYNYAGHATGINGTLPRYRLYTTLTWTYRGLEATVAQTFIPTVTDIGVGGDAEVAPVGVSSFSEWDTNVAYKLSALHLNHWLDGLIVRAGINNVFNAAPPLAPMAFTNTNADLSTYDGAIGREYYVSFDYKF